MVVVVTTVMMKAVVKMRSAEGAEEVHELVLDDGT
jgi:hypothetical protein